MPTVTEGLNNFLTARRKDHNGPDLLDRWNPHMETQVADMPPNWKDHIDVVTRKRTKVRLSQVNEKLQDPFEELTSSRRIVPLDAKHKEIIEELQRSGYTCVWVTDHHLLQTHTCAFQSLQENEDLKIEGFFKTSSQGKDKGTPNCFAFPLTGGAWKVFRFSPGISEAETWTQDKQGWTTCYFNRKPDLRVAARAMGGSEGEGNDGFQFDHARDALKAIAALGENVHLKDTFLERESYLKRNKDGRLVMVVRKVEGDAKPGEGWAPKKRGGFWQKVLNAQTEQRVRTRSSLSTTTSFAS
jgi:hypothetical protein